VIAVVTHDPHTGLLKTLVSNNRDDGALQHYEVALADVPTLSELALQRGTRVIHNMAETFQSPSIPNHWL